jgi:exopolyphosphatase/guanosine-5'-triphosphate,3'-diphosphate pyrophosphatase
LHRSAENPELEIELVAAASKPGEPPIDLSLERWSLRSCAPVVLEALGLTLRVREP